MDKSLSQLKVALILLCFLMICGACMSSKTQALCEKAVDDFHAKLNDGKFSEIYANSGQELKDTISEDKFNEFLNAVHRKLGNTTQKILTSWNTNYNTGGTFITLGYETQFAEDTATESFTFKINGDEAALVGYYVNSRALIVK